MRSFQKIEFILFLTLFSLNTYASLARVYGIDPNKKTISGEAQLKQAPRIRVRVQKSLKNVNISGTDLKRKFHLDNSTQVFLGRKAIRFNCNNLHNKAAFKKPVLLASLGSSTGLISLARERFKGLLHVVTSANNESCDVVHETSMETYISSLLAREMNSGWPLEALKAQAIAARSYALHKIKSQQVRKRAGHETYYHLESSEKHQVSGNYFDSNMRTQAAAQMTLGHILVDQKGEIAPVFFHAKCGGRTLRPDHVWRNKVSGYSSVACPYCDKHGARNYKSVVSLERIKSFISWLIKKNYLSSKVSKLLNNDIQIVPDKKFNRKLRIYIGDKMFSFKKSLLRTYFGRKVVASNNFEVTKNSPSPNKTHFVISGSGLGHGVGMCQLGALDLAQKGWDYRRILAHYFPGHTLKKVY